MMVVIVVKVCVPGEANQWVDPRSYDPIITNDDDDDVQDVIKMATGGVQSYYTTTL